MKNKFGARALLTSIIPWVLVVFTHFFYFPVLLGGKKNYPANLLPAIIYFSILFVILLSLLTMVIIYSIKSFRDKENIIFAILSIIIFIFTPLIWILFPLY